MATWSDLEVRALLAIWSDSRIQEELDGAVRNKSVYEKIAKKLQKQGHTRDWKQCRSKVKNLKTSYKEIKDHNNKTGNGRKQCKFYKELDCILGHRPASTPITLLDSGNSVTEAALDTDSDPDPEEANGKFRKKLYTYLTLQSFCADGSQIQPDSPGHSSQKTPENETSITLIIVTLNKQTIVFGYYLTHMHTFIKQLSHPKKGQKKKASRRR